ncbi:MAG: hypothetical protein ACF788_01350 [Novipirellula sp. JB048]
MVSFLEQPNLAPALGESEVEFVSRANEELFASVPEPMDRNHRIWEAWAAVHGNHERERADAKYPPDLYDKRSDVCYFSEHEAASVGENGEPIIRRYDAAKLAEIVGENNYRIADVDAYPTIIDRHTIPAGQRDASPPVTVGVSGPFRLGVIGRIEPRLAIFCDEYIRKDKAAQLSDRGGRSVEVLTLKSNGRSYINPIAAISEAPRLPLPVQFSANIGDGRSDIFIDRYSANHDVITERYEMIAPTAAALPGGGNTHVDKFDSPTDPDHQGTPNQGTSQMNEDALIRKIIDGIMNTQQMQWVQQQMQSSGTPAGGTQLGDGVQPQQFGATGAGIGAGVGALAGGPAGALAGGAMGSRFQSDEHRDDHGEVELVEKYQMLADKYQAMATGQQELVDELAENRSRLASLEVERADAVRTSRLRELAGRMPIDLDAELEQCLYSTGNDMSDAQFEQHCEVVERYAARQITQVPSIPQGAMPDGMQTDHETAQYQAQESQIIRQLSAEAANRGEYVPYNELKAEAKKRLAG